MSEDATDSATTFLVAVLASGSGPIGPAGRRAVTTRPTASNQETDAPIVYMMTSPFMNIAPARDSLLAHLPAPSVFRLATCLVIACAVVQSDNQLGVIPVWLTGPEENPVWIWSVDELENWDGKPEAFAHSRLGPPNFADELTPPIPHIGIFQGLQDRIDHGAPVNTRAVKLLRWHQRGVNHQVFLIERGAQWVILDAVAWADGVQF